jgi:hypothetical protein
MVFHQQQESAYQEGADIKVQPLPGKAGMGR